jgi:hypothetical protein
MLWQVVDHPASTVRQKIVSILGLQYSWVDLQEQRLICRRLAGFAATYSEELRRRIACEARVMAFCNQSVASNTTMIGDVARRRIAQSDKN